MQNLAFLLAKLHKRLKDERFKPIDSLVSRSVFYSDNAQFSTFTNRGLPKINVGRHGKLVIGDNTRTAPVFIGDDVFIGGHSTILEGVMIGEGAAIGACSVVTRDVPAYEIWAGNLARIFGRESSK